LRPLSLSLWAKGSFFASLSLILALLLSSFSSVNDFFAFFSFADDKAPEAAVPGAGDRAALLGLPSYDVD